MTVNVTVANESHAIYAQEICDLVYTSAQERGTGIAKRTPEYIIQKMKYGKAVIAITDEGELAGFAYIETWSHTLFVANSGLIVAHKFRKTGLAKRIKQEIFNLSRRKYPDAKIFSITTGLAVMKINSQLGFHPVPFSELTDDKEFWEGCKGCRNFDILERNNYKMCLCTGLLYDPQAEHTQYHPQDHNQDPTQNPPKDHDQAHHQGNTPPINQDTTTIKNKNNNGKSSFGIQWRLRHLFLRPVLKK